MLRRLLILSVVLSLGICSCSPGDSSYKSTRVIMGTYVTITAERGGLPEVVVRAAVADAFKEIERVDRLMSTYKPESQLSLVNREAGVKPVAVDPEVLTAVGYALDAAGMTDGAFDPTVGPLVKLWGIGGDNPRVPGPGEIEAARSLVDYRQVVLDRAAGTVFIRKKGMSLDLGGIAKGYASDLAVDALKERGIKGGIVAVAGDLKMFGSRGDGSPWKVGIQHRREEGGIMAKAAITDGATSTSGDYERYFMHDGVRYCHILDPKTGYPANGLISITVIAGQSYMADSLATGLFVLGPSKAYRFALSHPGIEVLMVDSKGGVMATGRFKGLGLKAVDVQNSSSSPR